jgi:hypothetical protein
VKLSVNTLQVGQRNLLFQNHLVERDDKVGVQETPVEDTQTEDSADELEVVQVFRVDSRVGVDLEGVVVVGRVLEQTVEGVEHLVREQEEELSACRDNIISARTSATQAINPTYLERPP